MCSVRKTQNIYEYGRKVCVGGIKAEISAPQYGVKHIGIETKTEYKNSIHNV